MSQSEGACSILNPPDAGARQRGGVILLLPLLEATSTWERRYQERREGRAVGSIPAALLGTPARTLPLSVTSHLC